MEDAMRNLCRMVPTKAILAIALLAGASAIPSPARADWLVVGFVIGGENVEQLYEARWMDPDVGESYVEASWSA